MGQSLSDPITEKASLEDSDYRLCYASSSMQGYRTTMEDAHTHILALADLLPRRFSFFGVYDGHGGDTAAHYAARHLHEAILAQEEFSKDDYVQAFKRGYLVADDNLRAGTDNGTIQRHISGCTAVSALVTPDNRLFVANAGDSRAILATKGRAVPLSSDHKPTNPDESKRIHAAGTYVELGRVSGALALSRALGDFSFKANSELPAEKQAVTALPDVIERKLVADDHFIVLACDGVWDCLTNQGVANFVLKHLDKTDPKNNLKNICEAMLDFCLEQSQVCEPGGAGWDNMTVVIVAFLNAGQEVVAISSDSPDYDQTKANETYVKWVEHVEEDLKKNGIDRANLVVETVPQGPSIYASADQE